MGSRPKRPSPTRGRGLLAIGLLLLSSLSALADPAQRVLSLNLCADQFLLALADPADIAGVTMLARDCRISAVCAAAVATPAVRGTAEEVIALHPGLVLGGPSGAGPALQAARRLGIPVLALDSAPTLDLVRAQITAVAVALGRPERGAALLAAFDTRLAAIPLPDQPRGHRPAAAVYQPNGFTAGPGSLADAVLDRAGLDNYATRQGLAGYGVIPLEYLVLHRPALLVTDQPEAAPSIAQAMLWHPALNQALAGRRVEVPGRDWICGGPATLDAVERLTQARLTLARQP